MDLDRVCARTRVVPEGTRARSRFLPRTYVEGFPVGSLRDLDVRFHPNSFIERAVLVTR